MKKLTLKQHWLIATGIMFAGLMVSTIDLIRNPTSFNWWSFAVAVVLVAIGYIYHRKFVRCPECGARLPSTTKFPEKCDACGEDLTKYS